MSENQNQEQQKHFLTLHISHKGQQKTLHFRIRHAAALCAAAAVLVGGTVLSVGAYQKTKTDLQASEEQLMETVRENRKLEQRAELLQNENNEYTENIDAIQNKTTELEQKMNEIQTVKDDLYDQINSMNASDSSSVELTAVATALEVSDAAPTFTSIISTSYNKASTLSAQLDKMNALMDETGVSFTAVAGEVTYALACQNNIPNGWPVESHIVSTEFNPTADASISDGRKHYGMDISTRSQILPISATAAGTVTTATYHPEFGYYVVIDHYNGFTTLYAHCTELTVNVGDKVKRGDIIGTTGTTGMSTGIHCHYEIQLNGVYQNPRDYLGE
ncbi:MAG: peptidoglycan DD-metalloendopeptidase family protein [Anaerotignum sp.]